MRSSRGDTCRLAIYDTAQGPPPPRHRRSSRACRVNHGCDFRRSCVCPRGRPTERPPLRFYFRGRSAHLPAELAPPSLFPPSLPTGSIPRVSAFPASRRAPFLLLFVRYPGVALSHSRPPRPDAACFAGTLRAEAKPDEIWRSAGRTGRMRGTSCAIVGSVSGRKAAPVHPARRSRRLRMRASPTPSSARTF